MLKELKPLGLAAVAGSALLTGQVAFADAVPDADMNASVQASMLGGMSDIANVARVSIERVEGVFNYNQTDLSSSEELSRAFKSSKYLCNSAYTLDEGVTLDDPLDWTISVGGEVKHAFTESLADLSKTGSASVVMGCVCAANDAGGLSVINADIKGIEIASLMRQADVSERANTIVFGCNDGYEVALPLSYVKYRYSMIVYEVNGQSLGDAVGGSNQLWLGATPGCYFGRDVTSITFETRQTPPPTPYTDEGEEYYGNFPGIGVRNAE